MIIYHGGTNIIEVPKILQSDKGKDFGTGFYTTDIKEQAVRWAQRKARAARRYCSEVKTIVNVYEFNETAYNNHSQRGCVGKIEIQKNKQSNLFLY